MSLLLDAHKRDISRELERQRAPRSVAEQRAEPATLPSATPKLTRMSDVTMRPIRWHWKRRLARGKPTILAGEPGISKSSLWIDLVARTTVGGLLPDGGHAPVGTCIILTAEDALDDTLKPRLTAAGADMTRVQALESIHDPRQPESDRLVSLDRDVAILEAAIKETGACMVVIDPLGAYLPSKLDSKTDHQVRAVLAPLAKMAERTDVALLVVMHLTKNAEKKVLHRVLGSVGFVASARIVLAVAEDPSDSTRRFLLPVKSNICQPAETLAYRVTTTTIDSPDGPCETLRLEWDATPVEGMTADEAFKAATEDRAEHADAETFLREFLEDGPQLSNDVLSAADSNGISRRTLFRLKSKLGVRATRVGGMGAAGKWTWVLTVPTPKSAALEVGTLSTLSEISQQRVPTTTKSANPPSMEAADADIRRL